MRVMIDIPEEDIPKVQGILELHLYFCHGILCQCEYPFDTDIEQEPSRDTEEIEEVINCDADAETKCKMISNILTANSHYFDEPQESEGEKE